MTALGWLTAAAGRRVVSLRLPVRLRPPAARTSSPSRGASPVRSRARPVPPPLGPGPVVITVAFIGYLVAGLPGATLAAIGIFLPVYILTIVPAPWFKRHRENAQLKAFVHGATAAATGAIGGAVVVLGLRSIYDIPTAMIALVSLGVLLRWKVQEPILVTACGLVGLLVWPIVRGSA
jgi:chromate transport protein ChrA